MTVALEDRTARLTILIAPRTKALFERLCAQEGAAASRVCVCETALPCAAPQLRLSFDYL